MDAERVGQNALVVADEARLVVIRNGEDYAKADEMWKRLNQQMKNIDEAYREIIQAAHAAWKKALEKKASYYVKVEEGAKFLKRIMGEYKEEQKRKILAEEARLRAEAIKKEEERRLQEAINAPKEEQDAILEAPVVIPPIVLQPDIPKTTGGARFREIWDAEVMDFPALVAAAASGKVSTNALLPNAAFLRKQAESLKETMNIPGVRAYSRMV